METPTRTRAASGPGRRAVLAAALWGVALVLVWAWGRWWAARGAVITYGSAPPFLGYLHVRVSAGTLVAAVLAGAVVVAGPRAARVLSWRALLLGGWATSAALAVGFATTDGLAALTAPLRGEHDYLAVVPGAAADPAGFLRTFVEQAPGYPVHVRGHPPGFPLLLAALDRAGLGGAGWATALVVVVGSSTVVAVGLTVRALAGAAGEQAVRRALPATVLAPWVLWVATSADALYAGVLAWGVALLAVASTTRGAWWPWAVAAGLVLGLCPFLSYGLLPMGALALVAGACAHRWAPTVVAGAVVVGSAAAWAAAGFWLGDGIAMTHVESTLGRAADRPYAYFLVADLVLLGALVGPAGVGGVTGLGRLPGPVRALVLVALGAAVLGALSGVERGEVERIWVPLACWVLLAAASLVQRRAWLLAQAATTVLLQVVLVSPW